MKEGSHDEGGGGGDDDDGTGDDSMIMVRLRQVAKKVTLLPAVLPALRQQAICCLLVLDYVGRLSSQAKVWAKKTLGRVGWCSV